MTTIAALEKIGNAWTHPKTGQVRYYINAEKAAEMAGITGTAYGEGQRALSKREFGQVLGCKFWLDSEGELHIEGHLPLTVLESDGFKTAEVLIREAVAEALANAEEVLEEDVPEEPEQTEDEEEEFDEADARIIIDTPQGPRYIEVPDYQGESLWDAIAKYDDANGTDLAERLEIDDILAAGQESTAYSCGPLDYEDLSWPFFFGRFDGNNGEGQGFPTREEAEAEAEMIWDHLTSEEREAYSEPGCYFMVIEGEISEGGDIGKVLRDFTEDIGEDEDARDRILRMVGELVLMGLSTMEALAWACTRVYDHQDAVVMMERLAGRSVPDQVARNYIHRAKSKLKG